MWGMNQTLQEVLHMDRKVHGTQREQNARLAGIETNVGEWAKQTKIQNGRLAEVERVQTWQRGALWVAAAMLTVGVGVAALVLQSVR
jgi:hypothetical protein